MGNCRTCFYPGRSAAARRPLRAAYVLTPVQSSEAARAGHRSRALPLMPRSLTWSVCERQIRRKRIDDDGQRGKRAGVDTRFHHLQTLPQFGQDRLARSSALEEPMNRFLRSYPLLVLKTGRPSRRQSPFASTTWSRITP